MSEYAELAPLRGDPAVIASNLLPPLAFFGQLAGGYALVDVACDMKSKVLLHLVSLLALGLVALSFYLAWTGWRRFHAAEHDDVAARRARFMARAGMLTSGFFFFLVIAMAIPNFVFGACE